MCSTRLSRAWWVISVSSYSLWWGLSCCGFRGGATIKDTASFLPVSEGELGEQLCNECVCGKHDYSFCCMSVFCRHECINRPFLNAGSSIEWRSSSAPLLSQLQHREKEKRYQWTGRWSHCYSHHTVREKKQVDLILLKRVLVKSKQRLLSTSFNHQ